MGSFFFGDYITMFGMLVLGSRDNLRLLADADDPNDRLAFSS